MDKLAHANAYLEALEKIAFTDNDILDRLRNAKNMGPRSVYQQGMHTSGILAGGKMPSSLDALKGSSPLMHKRLLAMLKNKGQGLSPENKKVLKGLTSTNLPGMAQAKKVLQDSEGRAAVVGKVKDEANKALYAWRTQTKSKKVPTIAGVPYTRPAPQSKPKNSRTTAPSGRAKDTAREAFTKRVRRTSKGVSHMPGLSTRGKWGLGLGLAGGLGALALNEHFTS
jgi:hypothetical protein